MLLPSVVYFSFLPPSCSSSHLAPFGLNSVSPFHKSLSWGRQVWSGQQHMVPHMFTETHEMKFPTNGNELQQM